MNTKHFVEFLLPGSFFSESTIQEIATWNVDEAKNIANGFKLKPFGFRFITKKLVGTGWDQQQVVDKQSGIYYIGGTVNSYHDVVKRNLPTEEILRSNMQCNNWSYVINTIYKNTYPFDPFKDKVI